MSHPFRWLLTVSIVLLLLGGEAVRAAELTQRQKRVLRWTMLFDTRDGDEYAEQLRALGAILAVPGKDREYLVIRDLSKRPVTGQVQSVVVAPAGDRSYTLDLVADGDAPDVARELASMVRSFDPAAR